MLKGLLSLSFLCSAIQLHAFQVVIFANPAYCGLNNGTAHASPQGGVAPYTYLWDNGATTQSIQDLAPGTYVVTVTDNSGATAQGTATIVVEANMSPYVLEERDACFGCNGRAQVVTPGFQGTPPFTYSTVPAQCSAFPATPGPNGSVYIDYLNGNQTYTITVTDANGCTGSAMADIGQIPSFYQHEAASIQPACGTASNGGFVIADLGGSAINWYVTGPNGIPQTFSFNNGPYVFSGLEAGTYTAAPYDPITGIHFWCEQDAVVVIPAIAPPCGSVSGRVFHDADQDCVFGGADVVIPWKVMTIVPGPMYALTMWDGGYSMNLPYGNFSIAQALNNEVQLCPVSDPVPFALNGGAPEAYIDFADSSTIAHDLSIHMESSAARPGFATTVWITVTNNSAYPSGTVTIDLSFDPLLLNPQPANGQWSIGPIFPYATTTVSFTAMVPNDIGLIGTVLLYNALATNTATEPNTANNAAFHSRTITASYDPNDKQGATSSGWSPENYYLGVDEWIDYTVRFQNTGTSAAETVIIRDTIDVDLDMTTLQFLGASHAFNPGIGDGRSLVFNFDNINLPDSAADWLGSQGFVSFRFKPRNAIVVGDELENTAGIYFDFNPPIITNTVTHVVELSTRVQEPFDSAQGGQGQVRVLPNPVSDVLNVLLPEATSVIEVFAIDGRCIQVPSTRRSDGFQLDVRELPAGLYYVRTAAGTARFVKQ